LDTGYSRTIKAKNDSRTSWHRQLEREAEAVRASYQSALERLNEVRSMAELQRGDARIVERAIVPGGPSGPRVVLFTMLGAVLGLTAAMLYVFIHTLSETTFARPGQVEEATGLPVAASLPVGQWHRRNLRSMLRSLRRHPYQKYVERLRQLRFGLVFNDEEEETVRSVLFTSSVPNEGKTSLSVSFARLEAVSKRKCILVDFDMRRSTLARELGYKPRGGDLAAYFRGEVALEDAIAPLPGIGFDLLTTLKPYPRFADEMDPAWVKALLEQLYQSYDMVVLDTPPLIAVPDTLSLVKAVDASVLLVKQGSTHRSAVQESARRLSEMGAHSVRVAMTMTDLRQEADTYGYSGSYTYGTK
jgi:Mrp family chromosome partitioning ATPase